MRTKALLFMTTAFVLIGSILTLTDLQGKVAVADSEKTKARTKITEVTQLDCNHSGSCQ